MQGNAAWKNNAYIQRIFTVTDACLLSCSRSTAEVHGDSTIRRLQQDIDAPGQLHVQVREATGVMVGDVYPHPVPNVAPLRVVPQGLGRQG
jgi:hypothetical protein